MEKNIINIISTLQAHYNILVIYHSSEPDKKRVFVVNQFIPIQSSYTYMDLRGKEITEMISDSTFYGQFSLGRQTGLSNVEFQESQFQAKIDDIPMRHYQFSPDYTWEWYLNN